MALALASSSGCAATLPPPASVAPSTAADPPAYASPPGAAGSDALASRGGAETARRLLLELVTAIRDGDGSAIEAMFAERVMIAAARHGRAHAQVTRAAIVRQLVAHSRATGVPRDAPVEELLDPTSIRVEPAAHALASELVAELAPGDLAVRFEVSSIGRRVLAGLAPTGSGTLVVRPGDPPLVVAR